LKKNLIYSARSTYLEIWLRDRDFRERSEQSSSGGIGSCDRRQARQVDANTCRAGGRQELAVSTPGHLRDAGHRQHLPCLRWHRVQLKVAVSAGGGRGVLTHGQVRNASRVGLQLVELVADFARVRRNGYKETGRERQQDIAVAKPLVGHHMAVSWLEGQFNWLFRLWQPQQEQCFPANNNTDLREKFALEFFATNYYLWYFLQKILFSNSSQNCFESFKQEYSSKDDNLVLFQQYLTVSSPFGLSSVFIFPKRSKLGSALSATAFNVSPSELLTDKLLSSAARASSPPLLQAPQIICLLWDAFKSIRFTKLIILHIASTIPVVLAQNGHSPGRSVIVENEIAFGSCYCKQTRGRPPEPTHTLSETSDYGLGPSTLRIPQQNSWGLFCWCSKQISVVVPAQAIAATM